jgi:hypothetical protein
MGTEDNSERQTGLQAIADDGIAYKSDIPCAKMTNAGLAGVCQLTVVAGARFELATFGL